MKTLEKSYIVGAILTGFLVGIAHIAPIYLNLSDSIILKTLFFLISIYGLSLFFLLWRTPKSVVSNITVMILFFYCFYLVSIHWLGLAVNGADNPLSLKAVLAGVSIGLVFTLFPALILLLSGIIAPKVKPDYQPILFAVSLFLAIWLQRNIQEVTLAPLSFVALGTPVAAVLPILGVNGLNALLALLAGFLALPFLKIYHLRWKTSLLAILAIIGIAIAIPHYDPEPISEISVGIVDFNLPNQSSIDAPENYDDWISSAVAEIARKSANDYTIFPEQLFSTTSQPMSPEYRRVILSANRTVLFGVTEVETNASNGDIHVYNSAIVATKFHQFAIRHKSFLAMFGEYMPQPFKAMGFNPFASANLSRGEPEFMLLSDGTEKPYFVLTICYESLFPEKLRRSAKEATWIANISSEAIFGSELAENYITEETKMTSLSLGQPIYKSVNHGRSGVFLPDGSFIEAVSTKENPAQSFPLYGSIFTIYKIAGDWAGVALLTLIALVQYSIDVPRMTVRGYSHIHHRRNISK